MKQKLFVFFLAVLCLVGTITPMQTLAASDPPQIQAESALLMDVSTGQVLYEKNMNAQLPVSTLAKIMTAILAIENKALSDTVTISESAIDSAVAPRKSSHISLVEGEELMLEQLLYAMLVQTANDAANAVAEYVSGSLDAFVELMNTKAQEIGCKNTHFVNPTGLDADGGYTTAYDMALITRYAARSDTFASIFSAKEYVVPKTNKSASRKFTTGCGMLKEGENYYDYLTGGFSGWTSESKYCCASTAAKGEKNFVCVVLKGTGTDTRYEDSKALFEYGFNNFSKVTLKSTDIPCPTIDIVTDGTKTGEVRTSFDKDVTLWLYDGLSLLDLSVKNDAPQTYPADPTSAPNMIITVNSDKMYATVIQTPYQMTVTHGVYQQTDENGSSENGFVSFLKTVGILILILAVCFIIFIIIIRIVRSRRRKRLREARRRAARRGGFDDSYSRRSRTGRRR